MIYLDSSALLKLVHEERESAALEHWLTAHGSPKVSSELAGVEVRRACRRVDADALPGARALLAGIDLIPMTGDLLDDAAGVGDAGLRTLDAIHLASALSIRTELSALVAYDRRLAEAGASAGLDVLQPGA